MSPRTTGIAFLVAAALFAFIYFYEIRGEEGRLQAEQAEKKLFPGIEAASVDSISFTTSEGVRARVARGPTGWELREPLVFPGDAFAADGMASALADLKSEAVYGEPQAPEVYGLGESAPEIVFEAGGETRRLRLGDKTPLDSNNYVSVEGDERVYAVTNFTINALRKSLDDLRDKRVARFEPDAVDRIEASWRGGGRVVLEKGGEGWSLLEPIQGPADESTVDALLSDLSFLRATGFEDEPPPDAEVGLDDPEWAVVLGGPPAEEGGEPLRVAVSIGSALEGDSRLLRSDSPSLYRIPVERISDFPRELVAYRFKQLSRFPAPEATRVELVFQRLVSSAEGDAPLEISATRGETGWDSEPERFRPGMLAQLVNELSRLRADQILHDEASPDALRDLGLEPPGVEIRVYGGDEEPVARVQIGADRGAEGFVARAAERPAVYLLSPELRDVIPVSLEAFREDFRSREEPLAADAEEAEAEPEDAEPLLLDTLDGLDGAGYLEDIGSETP